MYRPIKSFLIIVIAFLIAVAVAKVTNPFHSSQAVFKNSVGISFYPVNANSKELHKLYKSSAINYSKEASTSHYGRTYSKLKPEEFYVSKDDLTITDFADFISATSYTPDYFFSSHNPTEAKNIIPIISHQDAQVLANWLMSKEKVNYQIIDSEELVRACRDSVERTYLPFPFFGGGESFDMLCHSNHASSDDIDSFINGFRLIRDVN
jgi:hypothetical protein